MLTMLRAAATLHMTDVTFFSCAVVHSDEKEDRPLHQLRPEEEVQRCGADRRLRCESSVLPVC